MRTKEVEPDISQTKPAVRDCGLSNKGQQKKDKDAPRQLQKQKRL